LETPLFDPVFFGAAILGSKLARMGAQQGMTVYRVYGGGAGPNGASWTTVNPTTVPNYRFAAGLPAANHGTKMAVGVLRSTAGVSTRAALRVGAGGGLPEVIIPNASTAVDVLRVITVNF